MRSALELDSKACWVCKCVMSVHVPLADAAGCGLEWARQTIIQLSKLKVCSVCKRLPRDVLCGKGHSTSIQAQQSRSAFRACKLFSQLCQCNLEAGTINIVHSAREEFRKLRILLYMYCICLFPLSHPACRQLALAKLHLLVFHSITDVSRHMQICLEISQT